MILVTGLVMLYLTSVAAYVLPAVRVIENPLIGALAQAAVLAGISVVGFLRRSEGIVLLAFHLGYVLGVFMAWEGLREGALIAAGLLFLSGALLSRVVVFRRLVWVIIPGSYLVGLAFPALALWRTVEIPLSVPFQIYLNAVTAGAVILYLLNDYSGKWGPKVRVSMGTSLAILTLVLFFRSFYPDALDWAAFVLGCTLLAGAVAARILRGWGFLAQLLFVKATFLIAVWAVLYFAGDLRWMVLALQTAVVAISARRARAVAVECAAWAVAVASLHYFLPVLETNPVAGTFLWWMMALYPAVILIALAHVLPAFRMEPFHFREADRRVLYGALPVVALVLWFNLFRVTQAGNLDAPAPFIGVMYGTAALALLPGIARWIPATAS
ncbi:MAG: hypothetical protein RQ748_12715, partial [Elusimicrobiales bacterium]|nr:hypothetical protein [Elusimicrobiales bacterium]